MTFKLAEFSIDDIKFDPWFVPLRYMQLSEIEYWGTRLDDILETKNDWESRLFRGLHVNSILVSYEELSEFQRQEFLLKVERVYNDKYSEIMDIIKKLTK